MAASQARKDRRKRLSSANTAVSTETLQGHPDIQIREVGGKGRGLFWCPSDGKTLSKGAILLRLDPEVLIPDDDLVTTHCNVCLSGDDDEAKRCSKCKVVRYCSPACREADFPFHEEECKALVTMIHKQDIRTTRMPSDNVIQPAIIRLTARLVWKRIVMGEKWWESIEGLPWHKHEASDINDPYHATQLAPYLQGTKQKKQEIYEREAIFDLQELQDLSSLLARVNINALEIRTKNNKQRLGLVLSTVAAQLNHSCDANLALRRPNVSDDTKAVYIVALKDISAGQELTVSYVDPNETYYIKQRKLRQQYAFQCKCTLCEESKMNCSL